MSDKIVEVERRGGGAGMFALAIVVLLAIAVGVYAMSTLGKSESRKDDAVAAAAGKVGDAAKKAGDAIPE